MNRKSIQRKRVFCAMLMFIFTALILMPAPDASVAQSKRPITINDFDKFKSVSNRQLSNNGEWAAYVIKPRKGDGELTIINLKNDTKYVVERGSEVRFSDNSEWAAYMIVPHEKSDEEKKAEKKARKDKEEEPPKEYSKLEILNLKTDGKYTADKVQNFKFSDDSKFLAYKLEKPEKSKEEKEKEKEEAKEEEKSEKPKKKKTTGSEVILRNLKKAENESFQFVMTYDFSEKSKVMYFTVSSENDDEDGIFIKEPGKDDPPKAILSGKGKYQNMVFNEDNNKMLFLTDRDDQDAKTPSFTLYSWKMNDDNANLVIDPKSTPGFPEDMQLAASGLRWSKDDKSAFFNISERKKEEPEEDEEDDDEEKAKVIIWHWKDSEVKPREQARLLGKTTGSRHVRGGRREQTYQAVYNIKDGTFIRLTDEVMQSATIGPNDKFAVGTDPTARLEENPWSITIDTQRDYYLVDLKDGSKQTIEIETHWGYQWSGEGKYLLQYAQPHWFVYDITTGEKRNLTENLSEAFWNTDDDHPDYKRAWGLAGWTKDDEGVLIYDKYDIWYFPVKKPGQPVNVTKGLGRKMDARFRYRSVDPEEEFIDIKKPIWLSFFDNKTKASGLYEVKFENEPAKVYVVDKGMRYSRKAKDADVYMFTMSTYFEYGDLYISDKSFTNVRKLTDANPENNGLLWGKSQLIEYTNQNGVKLQGILSLPENYEPGRKYPMIIYFYEKLTQGLHNWRAPSTGSGFSAPYFNSRGYVVLQPDIIYTDGYPGPSSVKCVVPAAQKVIDMGIADPNAIAITGHSWGGYQTAFIVTQTDMFACAYAGAPVSNMTSAYGGIRWASGMNRAHQYERTQSRIGGSIWENLERYIENSPLFFADRVNTPILLMHGDEDGAVPWYQSIEYYIGLRRNNKPVWFLQYETEPHGLRGDANKKDFTIRRDEFFDHYLMGKPMPKWMSKGMKIGEDPAKR